MRSHIVSATSSVCVDIMIVWPRLRVFAEQILENARRLRVEADHRLVDDDHLGPVHERARDDELLPHAVAVALDQLVAPLLEIEQREQLARRGARSPVPPGRTGRRRSAGTRRR